MRKSLKPSNGVEADWGLVSELTLRFGPFAHLEMAYGIPILYSYPAKEVGTL
jgi:hypothetical protein